MSTAVRPLNGESYSLKHLSCTNRSSPLLRKPSPSQFPLPPGAPPWPENPQQITRRRTMEDKNGTQSHGRISPYTLSVAAEFSLKRANKQLLAMGETLESVKSELSPTRANPPPEYRVHSRSSSAPISPVTTYVPRSSDGFSSTGDMLSDMRKLA